MNYFEKFKQIFTEAANDSDGLKEGGGIRYKNISDIVLREGRRRPIQQKSVNANTAIPGSGNQIGNIDPMPGFVSYVERIEISTTKKCDIEILVGNVTGSVSENSFSFKTRVTIPRGKTDIKIEDFALQGAISSIPCRVTLYEVFNDDDTVATDKSYTTFVNIIAKEIYEDFEPNNAPSIWIGDSVMRGQPGITYKENHYIWKSKLEFRKKGIRLRVSNRALGGSTSVEQNKYIQKGLYNTDDFQYVFYGLGVNDSVNGSYQADYTASLTAAIQWAIDSFPSLKKFIVLAPHRSSIPANEVKYAALRTIAQNIVTADTSGKVLICNLGTVDITAVNGYYLVDGAGVHLNDAGHAALFTGSILPFIESNF